MVFTYDRNQRSVDLVDTTNYRKNITGGKYRPTQLIRVNDWAEVLGTEVGGGYCAVSYCWAQSGTMVDKGDGEYDCIEKTQHGIVEKIEECIISGQPNKRQVTFEQLLRQICQDFEIDYLWFDKRCINQLNKEEKHKEIQQIHNIYSNARYTLAIVPEFGIDQKIGVSSTQARYNATQNMLNSKWWTRSWTLEEINASKHILVVGKDINMWQHSLHSCRIPTVVDCLSDSLLDFRNQKGGGTVNQALNEAHFRTSSKEHDIIFALGNTFPDLFSDFKNMTYDTDIKITFNTFYQQIATKDHSILCFGSNLCMDGNGRKKNTVQHYNLPSWTGVAGLHPPHRVTTTTEVFLESYHINKDTMKMQIATQYYWKVSVTPYKFGCFSVPKEDIDKEHRNGEYRKLKADRLDGHWKDITTDSQDEILMEWDINMATQTSCTMTHYHQYQGNRTATSTRLRPLSLTEDCDECFVLPILLELHKGANPRIDDYYPISIGTTEYFRRAYLLPVFKKYTHSDSNHDITTEEFKSVGVYLVGLSYHREKSFRWNDFVGEKDLGATEESSEEILNALFENNCHEKVKQFIIV